MLRIVQFWALEQRLRETITQFGEVRLVVLCGSLQYTIYG